MYTGKEQGVENTLSSFWLAVLWKIIATIENDSIVTGRPLDTYYVYFDRIYDLLEGFEVQAKHGTTLKIYISPLPDLIDDDYVEAYDTTLIYDILEGEGVGYKTLLRASYKIPFIFDRSLFRAFAHRTAKTNIEYMFLFLDDGSLVYLEGYENRVSIPHITSVATLHTHPAGACMLSAHDVESASDILIDGGFFSGAITENCAILLARTGILDEDDFIELKKFSNKLRKYSDHRSILTAINELERKARNVTLVRLSF